MYIVILHMMPYKYIYITYIYILYVYIYIYIHTSRCMSETMSEWCVRAVITRENHFLCVRNLLGMMISAFIAGKAVSKSRWCWNMYCSYILVIFRAIGKYSSTMVRCHRDLGGDDLQPCAPSRGAGHMPKCWWKGRTQVQNKDSVDLPGSLSIFVELLILVYE